MARLKRLQSTPPSDPTRTLVRMGREAGDRFTFAELQEAFARESAMRWLRYRRRADDGVEEPEHTTSSPPPGGRGGRSAGGPDPLL